MKKTMSLIILIVLGITDTLALQHCPIPSYSATYSVFSGKRHLGDHEDTLQYPSATTYTIHGQSHFHVFIFSDHLQSISKGTYSASSFSPTHYHFSESAKGAKINKAIAPGHQDNLSLNLALAMQLKKQPKTRVFSLTVNDGTHIRKINFSVRATRQRFHLKAFGVMPTRLVIANTLSGPTYYFLAKKLNYLPVIIKKTQNKKKIKSILTSYKTLKSPGCSNG